MIASTDDYRYGSASATEPPARGGLYNPHFRAIEGSYRSLKWVRNLTHNLVKEYHGPAYGTAAGLEKPLNKLHQAVDACQVMLASQLPRVTIRTERDELFGFAAEYEAALNALIAEIRLEKTLRQWVLDAFFSVGVVKVHLKDSAPVMFENDLWMDPGSPFASNISIDDFVYDTSAKKWSEVKFAADMYRIPFADIAAGVEQGMYRAEATKDLAPTSKFQQDQERLRLFSTGDEMDSDEFEPMIDLADVWVARERKIYTFAVQDRSQFILKGEPLAEMEWREPNHGPYHILGFNDVPDNIMPLSPASHLQRLDRDINSLCRKLILQADRQRTNPVYTPQGQQTMQNLKNTADGVAINGQVSDVGMITIPGADPGNQQFMLMLLELFSQMGGNIDAIMGLGAQAKTVGQEQLIHDAGNRKFSQMQYRVVEATTQLCESLGFMLWEDEYKTIASRIPIEGTDYTVPVEWKPGDRMGRFEEFKPRIGIYSMVNRPPAQQADTLMGTLERAFVPFLQMMMQQGGQIDFARLAEDLSDMLDIPELRDVVTFSAPPAPSPAGEGGGMPSQTTRRYERQSIPSASTPGNRMEVLKQALGQAAAQQSNPMGTTAA